MYRTDDFNFAPPNFSESFAEPTPSGQHGSFVDQLLSAEPPAPPAAPSPEPAIDPSIYNIGGDLAAQDGITNYSPHPFNQGMEAPEGAHVFQEALGVQAFPQTFVPQPPMVVSSQPNYTAQSTYATQATYAQEIYAQPAYAPQPAYTPQPAYASQPAYAQPAYAPQPTYVPQPPLGAQPAGPVAQPPQPVPAPQVVQAALVNQPLPRGYAQGEAPRISEKLKLFRINQWRNDGCIRDKNSRLKTCRMLGLSGNIADNYQAVCAEPEGIPLFVNDAEDWDTAFGLLGEVAFHLFRRKELEKAQTMGETLPALDPVLQTYITMYPPHEEFEEIFSESGSIP